MKIKGPKRKCSRCQYRGTMKMTSASPGDGRPVYVCPTCEESWSEGKKENQGYKSWK